MKKSPTEVVIGAITDRAITTKAVAEVPIHPEGTIIAEIPTDTIGITIITMIAIATGIAAIAIKIGGGTKTLIAMEIQDQVQDKGILDITITMGLMSAITITPTPMGRPRGPCLPLIRACWSTLRKIGNIIAEIRKKWKICA